MNQKFPFLIRRGIQSAILLFAILCSSGLAAQVSSLTYPTPTIVIVGQGNLVLSPNLSGNPISFSISPNVLPAGLSFNTNTGIISGIASAASPATIYTVTANSTTNSTQGQFSLQVTDNNIPLGGVALKFPGGQVLQGNDGTVITNTTSNTYGRSVGQKVLYKAVATLSGTVIDCIVTTLEAPATWVAYDQNSISGSGYSNNKPEFFSPQFTFPNSGGGATLNYQFILGGSYNFTTQSGFNVVLQNAKINSYDIDGNDGTGSQQSSQFSGFTTYELTNDTRIVAPTLSGGLTVFKASQITNYPDVLDPRNRVRVSYDNISSLNIRLTGVGAAYFFIDFSAGEAFNSVVPKTSPSIDLNTATPGVNDNNAGCGTELRFIPSGQTTNVISSNDLTQFTIRIPETEIKDGANEKLRIAGATPTDNFPLQGPIVSFTLGGTLYNANSSNNISGIRTIIFKPSGGGTISQAQAQAILAALRYTNTSPNPTPGDRNFTVNVNNTTFQSPDAIYTAKVNCISISGNIFHDINGMTDNLVNAVGTPFVAGFVYAVLTNTSNQVVAVKPISAGGAYNFGQVTPGMYNIYVSSTNPAINSSFTAPSYPTGYVSTGENLGAGPGNDLLTDGKLVVTVGTSPIINANFGIEIPPTSSDKTISNINNPGGFNNYTIPANSFTVGDADGSVKYITLNSFPTGAQYIKIGATYYIPMGGTCPPQAGGCTTFVNGQQVPFTANNPVPAILVSPLNPGITSIAINFTAFDDANIGSTASTLTLNFIDASRTISGNVWDDANGNGVKEGTEPLVAPASPGQTLYAVVTQTTNTYSGQPTIFSSAVVDATTGYSLPNVPINNNYIIKIVSLPTAPVAGALATTITPNLPANWIGVSTNANGTITAPQSTNNLQIAINGLTANLANQNFGIEQLPNTTDVNVSITKKVFIGNTFILDGRSYVVGQNSNTATVQFPPLPGTDPEDGALGSGKSVKITTVPNNADLYYNGVLVTAGQVITNYDPSLLSLTITAGGSMAIVFNFAYLDAAGQLDPTPATYNIDYVFVLPVQLISFTARGNNGDGILDWSTSSEQNSAGFGVEHSTDGNTWNLLGFVSSKATNGNSNQKLSYQYTDKGLANGTHYYRLKQTDLNGEFSYSNIAKVDMNSANAAFKVYPNPANSYLFIEYSGATKTPVRIIDMSGRVMKSLFTTGVKTRVDTNEFPAGTYIISIDGKINKFTVNR